VFPKLNQHITALKPLPLLQILTKYQKNFNKKRGIPKWDASQITFLPA
jgi:hypothetical protein